MGSDQIQRKKLDHKLHKLRIGLHCQQGTDQPEGEGMALETKGTRVPCNLPSTMRLHKAPSILLPSWGGKRGLMGE